jgi:hemoglobin
MESTDDALATVERMVRLFYERALADEMLGPIFRAAVHDWEPHIATVRDFWSGVLHSTNRYQGNAFAPHAKLRFEPEAFDHWLNVFESAARDALSRQDAEKAIRIGRHMAESFKVGIFPFTGPDGRPSRTP